MTIVGYWSELMRKSMPKEDIETRQCFCVGPQNGQPLCPCRMRGVREKDGRYVIPERDIGPVVKP